MEKKGKIHLLLGVFMSKKFISSLLTCSIILSGIFSVSFFAPQKANASKYNNLTQLPFMGWSSWSSIRKNPTEESLKKAADILAAKFKSHGYQYVNLDDFYQLDWTTTVDHYGRWVVDPRKFPHGMKSLGDYIHKKGLKFGLYVTPGIPKAAVDRNTPIEGTPYHAKDIADLSKGQERSYNFQNMYYIDYSKPGAQEFIDSWAKLLASYGVDYLKIDGVGTWDIPDIKAWAKALKNTGRPIHLELSNNLDIKSVSTWKDLSNGWRTSRDVESYGKETITDWDHVSKRFAQAANWQRYAGPGGWNDFDSLNVANGNLDGLTDEEKRSYVSLWAIAASHFVIGSSLTSLDNYGVSLLTNDEIIAADQSGVAGKRLSRTSTSQVFYQHLSDGSYNIGLFNTGPSKETVSVKWTALGINGSAMVHDMWNHQDLGSFDSGFKTSLSTHDSRMIHVIPTSSLAISPISGATDVNPSQVSFNWSSYSTVEGYHVIIAADPSFKKIIFNQIVSTPKIVLNNLKMDTRYYWKVASTSTRSEKLIGIFSFHTKMSTTPAAPDWVLTERKDKDSVSLSWNPTLGSASYTVYRKKVNTFGSNGSYTPIASNLMNPFFVDKTATHRNGVKYAYIVTAKNSIGESKKSFEAQIDDQLTAETAAFLSLFITIIVFSIIFITNRNNSKYTRSV